MPQIANQDYFNLGDVYGGYPTTYAVVCQESRGTLLDCFFDAIGDLKGKFRVCSYYREDDTLSIRYCGSDQNPNYFTISVSFSIETYRVLANIQNQVGGDFTLEPDANNYLLADSAHVCVDGHGIIITVDDDGQIASCVKGDAITEGQIVNIAEEDMQYLIGVSLY